MQLNRRVLKLKPSVTLELNQKAKTLKSQGASVVNLTAGEPDLPTPPRICSAGIDAIERGETRYTASSGIPELKDAILSVTQKTYGRKYGRNEVIVSSGAKHSLFNLCMALLNEGDEVIVFAPYWVSYLDMVALAGAKPVVVETSAEDFFCPEIKALESAVTSRTRLIILNSPSNPTGAVYSAEFLAGVAKIVAARAGLLVVTDDIYEKLIFDNRKFESIGMYSEIPAGQLVIVNGVSKSYAMTGWRIGYTLGPKELVAAMDVIQSNSTSNPTTISQWAALEALSGDQREVEQMRAIFETRRNRFFDALVEIPAVECVKPSGAFYFFPSVRSYLGKKTKTGREIRTDFDLADYLLMDHGVATVPGSAFGADGFIRLSYAASESELEEGIRRLRKGLTALEG